MSIPPQSPTAKNCRNILNVAFLGASSCSLVSQIQQIMGQSLWRRCSRSVEFGPHVLLLWSIAEWTRAVYTLPGILGERCLEVMTGNSFLNFPHATQRLRQWHCHNPHRKKTYFSQIAKSGLYIKLGVFDIHMGHWSAVRLANTHGAGVVFVGHLSTSDVAALLMDPQLAPCVFSLLPMPAFLALSVEIHSSWVSMMSTKSSAYRSFHCTPVWNLRDNSSSTRLKSSGLRTEP